MKINRGFLWLLLLPTTAAFLVFASKGLIQGFGPPKLHPEPADPPQAVTKVKPNLEASRLAKEIKKQDDVTPYINSYMTSWNTVSTHPRAYWKYVRPGQELPAYGPAILSVPASGVPVTGTVKFPGKPWPGGCPHREDPGIDQWVEQTKGGGTYDLVNGQMLLLVNECLDPEILLASFFHEYGHLRYNTTYPPKGRDHIASEIEAIRYSLETLENEHFICIAYRFFVSTLSYEAPESVWSAALTAAHEFLVKTERDAGSLPDPKKTKGLECALPCLHSRRGPAPAHPGHRAVSGVFRSWTVEGPAGQT